MAPATPIIATEEGSTASLRSYAAGERQAAHAHRLTSVTLILKGALEEEVERETATGAALSVVVKPAGVEHTDRFGSEGALTLQVELSPRDERCLLRAGVGLSEWRWLHAGAAARGLLGLLRVLVAARRVEVGAPPPAGARLLQAMSGMEPTAARQVPGAPPWLRAVRDRLNERSVPIRAVAAEAGIHPVRLAREFHRHFGMAPAEFRRRARLGRAAALIVAARLPLVEAALEAGYADQPHMSRDLHSFMGTTPQGLRHLVSSIQDAAVRGMGESSRRPFP